MGLRRIRKKIRDEKIRTAKRFERHRRRNLLATPGVHPFIIVLDNLKPGYNIGKIFRSADAFGCHEIFIIGTDFFNPNSAMGSFKWVPARFHERFETCYDALTERGYRLFVFEPGGTALLPSSSLPEKSAFIFGHEEYGISFKPEDYPEIERVSIPQFGRVESLNVSVAASIVMYEYVRQNGLLGIAGPVSQA